MDMLELYHVMKLQDFISSFEFRIENESKVDEINIEVRNRAKVDPRGVRINLGFDPASVWTQKK